MRRCASTGGACGRGSLNPARGPPPTSIGRPCPAAYVPKKKIRIPFPYKRRDRPLPQKRCKNLRQNSTDAADVLLSTRKDGSLYSDFLKGVRDWKFTGGGSRRAARRAPPGVPIPVAVPRLAPASPTRLLPHSASGALPAAPLAASLGRPAGTAALQQPAAEPAPPVAPPCARLRPQACCAACPAARCSSSPPTQQ